MSMDFHIYLAKHPHSKVIQEIIAQLNHFSPKLATLLLQTALANKSSILQIFPHSKFWINRITGSKVTARKLIFSQQKVNFLSITFEPVV